MRINTLGNTKQSLLRGSLNMLGLGAALLAFLSGCGAIKQYRLPVPGSAAHATFAPLAACATQRNLQAMEQPDSFNVKYDPNTWIQFAIQGDQYNMVIVVDKGVAEEQRESRALAAKQKGDELFGCAQQQVAANPIAVGAQPGGAAVEGPVSQDPCERLVACYAILARDLCQPGGECQFKVELKGNDPQTCLSSLGQVPRTVEAFAMIRPGYVLATTCH